jgi:excisionase family DNA binding protein
MTPEIIDATQCADMLGCEPEHAEELARCGDIPAVKIGRSWRFVRADLLAFLAERARKEAEERRAKRAPQPEPQVRARRRVPPVLPTVAT